jgi:hypothetical protein
MTADGEKGRISVAVGRYQWWLGAILVIFLLGTGGILAGPANAASLPSSLTFKTVPSPLVAPSEATFIVVTPGNFSQQPAKVVLLWAAHEQTVRLTRVAPHEFAGNATLKTLGAVVLKVESHNGLVLTNRHEVVKQAPEHWATKIGVGGLFLLASLYYWRRMQKLTPRN